MKIKTIYITMKKEYLESCLGSILTKGLCNACKRRLSKRFSTHSNLHSPKHQSSKCNNFVQMEADTLSIGKDNIGDYTTSRKEASCSAKSSATYRPFANADECWNEMRNHQPFGWVKRFGNYTKIAALDNNTVAMSNTFGEPTCLYYQDCEGITFVDGQQFGIKEEN